MGSIPTTGATFAPLVERQDDCFVISKWQFNSVMGHHREMIYKNDAALAQLVEQYTSNV